MLVDELSFDVFEGFFLRLREESVDEEISEYANAAVEPECSVGAQCVIEQGEGEGQGGTADPEGKDGD